MWQIFFKKWQIDGWRDHRNHIQRLEAHVIDQPVGQRVRRAGKLRLADMGGAVERSRPRRVA
jgi:hypothetical protein